MSRRNRMSAFNRRQFLAAAGLGSGSLFLPSLVRGGGEGKPPLRLLVFYTLHGAPYETWNMRPGNLPEDEDWEVDLGSLSSGEFSECLEPLYGWRDDLLVLDGLAMVGPLVDQDYDAHPLGQIHCLTGAPILPIAGFTAGATAPSVDQIIADAIRRPDRFRSMEFAPGQDPGLSSPIWSLEAQPIPVQLDPMAAYQQLFPGVDSGQLHEDARVEDVFLRQDSVLDMVAERYEALLPRLSGADRQKLEVHKDLVRSAELRLGSLENLTCEIPDPPNPTWYQASGDEYYDDKLQAFAQLTATAFACDLTRVVSFQCGDLMNERFGAPPGEVHRDFAHLIFVDQSAKEHMTNYYRVHAEQFAFILETLASVPENGGTLLDNTVVLWCSELADGAHRMAPWPAIIAGGRNAGFDLGRYVRWHPRTPGAATDLDNNAPIIGGVPHNRLLVALCHQLGVPVDRVGLTEATLDGETYDFTAPLSRLT